MKTSDKLFIEADLHCHSLASSHAYSTVMEMASEAAKAGLKMFALTDHAMAMPDAPHVWHFHNLPVIPQKIDGVTVLRGVEANIMNFDGDIDMVGDDLKGIQWVVASCHAPVIDPGTVEENTSAYINAIKKNPAIDVIGHCSAFRYPVDFEKIAKACREYNVFVELNESSAQFKRSTAESCIELLNACKKYETPILVNTDCHYAGIIGRTPVAQVLLEAADFPETLIFNRDVQRVLEYVSKKHNIIFSED
ncbi:MAG: phosphatase [Oscillospiraceae bacterium]|nr:phosphatase [Oscillospiraceae bacterium]